MTGFYDDSAFAEFGFGALNVFNSHMGAHKAMMGELRTKVCMGTDGDTLYGYILTDGSGRYAYYTAYRLSPNRIRECDWDYFCGLTVAKAVKYTIA